MTKRPRAPRLLLVSDAGRARLPLLDLAAEAVAGGVDAIYLRDLGPTPAERARVVHALRARVGARVALLINGDAETVLTLGTGLHLRETDPAPSAARAILGPEALIGRAVHAAEAAAVADGADFVLAGHVYPSVSKPGRPPLGVEGLAAIAAAAPCATIAIGGITPQRVAEVVRAGAVGVAVIGAIVEAADPRAAAADLRAALGRALREETRMRRETTATIEVVINGKTHALEDGATIHDFLASKGMTDAMAIVERNGAIVPRAAYATTELQAGDRLEIVHAVGGG
jgi:thiamine biosynthesis protein ThiS